MTTAGAIAIIVLSLVGLYIAGYFTLVYYQLIRADSRLIPSICRLEEHACKTVIATKYAHVFGLPNSLLGAIYYAAVIFVICAGWFPAFVGMLVIAVAWFTVAVGVFLTYVLFFVIRIACPLCLAGHTINLILAILLTVLFVS
jgi:uncharacterized membrane protein